MVLFKQLSSKLFQSKSLLTILFLITLQAIFTFSSYQVRETKEGSLPNLGKATPYSRDIYTEKQPVIDFRDDNAFHRSIELTFQFRGKNGGGVQSQNFFQTSDEGSGLRLEQIYLSEEEAKLLVQYRSWNEERSITSSQTFNPQNRNDLRLVLTFDNRLTILVNNQEFIDAKISKQDIRFDNFVLGTGLSKSRPYLGEISKITWKIVTAKRQPLFPVQLLLVIWLGIALLRLFMIKNMRSLLNRTYLNDFLIAVAIGFLAFRLQASKAFAEFFGDDYLNIFPVRRSDPITLFTETLGPYFRPVTELAFLIRWEIHKGDINQWRLGNLLIASLIAILFFLLLRVKIGLNRFTAGLISLILVTSPIFSASAFWWSSNGTQHGIQLLLTIGLLWHTITWFDSNKREDGYSMFYYSFVLCITSEIFLPICLAVWVIIFLSESKAVARNDTHKGRKRGIFVNSIKTDKQLLQVSALSLLTLIIVRETLVQTPLAVAASSAANFKFDSWNSDFFFQYVSYLASFINLFFSTYIFDLGSVQNSRVSMFSESSNLFQIVMLATLTSILILLLYFTLSIFKKRVRLEKVDLGLIFLLLIGVAIPSLVPDYMQLRWIQTSFLCLIVLAGLKAKSLVETHWKTLGLVSASLLITTNFITLNAEFGISL